MSESTVEERLKALETLGFNVEFDGTETEAEQREALDQIEKMIGGMMSAGIENRDEQFETLEPDLGLAERFVADVAPMVASAVDELRRAHGEELEDDPDDAAQQLFMTAYNVLAEHSLVMTLDHWDPIEIGRLLNAIFERYGQAAIESGLLEELEDEMEDADDPQAFVWSELLKAASDRGLAVLELVPLGGAWSDQALVVLAAEHEASWRGKAIGDYALQKFG